MIDWKDVTVEKPSFDKLRCKIKIYIQTIDDEAEMEVNALYKKEQDSFTFLLGASRVEIYGDANFLGKENLFHQRIERQLIQVTHWDYINKPEENQQIKV